MHRKIAIIGAGPAGLISGLYLVMAGHRVTIFEKKHEVISTPCGEGISHDATEELKKDTGFDSSPHFSKKVNGLKNFFPKNRISFIGVSGYVLDREKWMRGMQRHFEKLGGELIFDREIKKITELSSFDFIVGADGPNSFIRKYISGKVEIVPASQYKMELDWENKDWLEFYWDKDISNFYSWNFPKKNYYNVGVIGNFNHLDNLLKKYNIKGNIIKKEAYPIPFNGINLQQENIALIGDAAGMANPFSKGGLAVLIYASRILVHCINQNNLSDYEFRIKSHIAFSNLYKKVCTTIKEISQNDLESIGEIVHEYDMFKLPLKAYLKTMKYPHVIPKMITIYSGFKNGIKYGW